MSRYREPRVKKVRALATVLPGLTLKGLERRPYPPGQHGQSRRKISAYGLRLMEKQKLIFNYGVSEKQLRRTVVQARKMAGITGERILELLERRLDNAVFRAGYARTIPAARQLVGHGHIRVNGKRVDRASFLVEEGMVLSLGDSAKANELIKATIVDPVIERPTWLELDEATSSVRVTALPSVDSVPIIIDTQLVVEHYAQSL